MAQFMLVNAADHPLPFERLPLVRTRLCGAGQLAPGPFRHRSALFLVPTSMLTFLAGNFYATQTEALFLQITSVRANPREATTLWSIGANNVLR